MNQLSANAIRRVCVSLALLAILLVPQALLAQGCALCYTQAAASTQRFIAALRSGIIILMVPPMFLSIMFTVMAYRRRNTFNDGVGVQEFADEELASQLRDH